jgi:hypothetical protein
VVLGDIHDRSLVADIAGDRMYDTAEEVEQANRRKQVEIECLLHGLAHLG